MARDDFRDYMLSFLFLRYLSDNYDAALQAIDVTLDGRRIRFSTSLMGWHEKR